MREFVQFIINCFLSAHQVLVDLNTISILAFLESLEFPVTNLPITTLVHVNGVLIENIVSTSSPCTYHEETVGKPITMPVCC